MKMSRIAIGLVMLLISSSLTYAMTASEIMQGASFGWNTFKLFPANLVGGINGIKTFAKVFPEIKFCPTGGVNEQNHLEFLAEESVISIGGSWLIER